MYSNITSKEKEREIRREWELLTNHDSIRVVVSVSKFDTVYVPRKDGNEEIVFVFRPMDVETYKSIENVCQYRDENDPEKKMVNDYDSSRMAMIKTRLAGWSEGDLFFDENNWLTDKSMELILRVPAPILSYALSKYEESFVFSDEEDKKIDRQSSILFSKNSSGVSNACEAVSLFCTLSNFWDKFGLNYYDIKNIPYKQFMMLRIMVDKENEAQSAEMRRASNAAGAGKSTMRGRNTGQPIVRQMF